MNLCMCVWACCVACVREGERVKGETERERVGKAGITLSPVRHSSEVEQCK